MGMKSKSTVLAVDGNSLAMRSIFGYKGELSHNALPGFFQMLTTLARSLKPDMLIVGFDGPNNIRKHRFPFYKSTRPKTDPEIAEQLQAIKEEVSTRQLNLVSFDGWEADDVVASIATTAVSEDVFCYIGTSDRDAYGNISRSVTVANFQKGVRDLLLVTPEMLFEKYGIKGTPVNQYLDFAALRGDPSDNISGVAGIGEVTAKNILKEMTSINDFYQNPSTFEKTFSPLVYRKLLAGETIFYRNLEIMTPKSDLPIDLAAAQLPRRQSGAKL
jgi:DNA polymerase-1